MMMTLHACKPVDMSLPTPMTAITTATNVGTATIVVYTEIVVHKFTATTTVMKVMKVMMVMTVLHNASANYFMDGHASVIENPCDFCEWGD